MEQKNKFIIIREDLLQDPVTIFSEGVLIGRLKECELLLNHPYVSRAQAGIKEIDGNYYVFPLRTSNPVKLNGKPVEENEALAPGDVLEVPPFVLEIDTADDALVIKVSLQIGSTIEAIDVSSASLETSKLDQRQLAGKKASKPRSAPIPGTKALDIFWDKRIRDAGKMMRHSPLFPRSKRRAGKSQFNWIPTTDLLSRWPAAVFIWGTIVVGLLSLAAAYWYSSAYAPAPIAWAHTKSRMELTPAIAMRANDGACMSCHSIRSSLESNCAACHNTERFVATTIKPHEDAGIGCIFCHQEHRGADFKAATAALLTCTECHNDANRRVYNGRSVKTAHGGTLGYPVVDGKWHWKGLSDDDWALKQTQITRATGETDEQWRSKQFHALHMQRVRTVAPLQGNAQGQLSCSSCHKSFDPIDRETPRTTCSVCHNGKTDPANNQVLVAQDKPNCTSCHVQHVKSRRHWNPGLLG
jgi:hypothetical protein